MNQDILFNKGNTLLEVQKFSRALDNPSQCYKFYWLEAILEKLNENPEERVMRFEDIIDRMIANAWYTVTTYHLHMGPGREGNEYSDNVERVIIELNKVCSTLNERSSKADIIEELHKHDDAVRFTKNELTKNVPYRLLSPFLDVPTKDWYRQQRMIEHIRQTDQEKQLPYTIIPASRPLDYRIVLSEEWAAWMLREYAVLLDWINYNKVLFLQGRNPGVPGIMYKLEAPGKRKLDDVKKLWKEVLRRNEVIDIYTGHPVNDEKYDIDHFVPWSYTASDELWNLIPADGGLNSSKSNRLPDWDKYAPLYLENHYRLYGWIYGSEEIYRLFRGCSRHNLNSRWAQEQLYLPGHSEHEFKGILEKNMKQVYDAAKNQGFGVWSR